MPISNRSGVTALVAVLIAIAIAAPDPARAQTTSEADAASLARQTQNPVGDLISVPLQFNFNSGGDLEDRTFFNLNVQPVIPFRLSSSWNVIARTVVPLDSMPGEGTTRFNGIGDIQEQLYITPAKPGSVIWGVGPLFSLPTATVEPATTGSWAMGAGAVVAKMTRAFVLGGLINKFWTFADDGGDPTVNLFVIQPFVNYNFGSGYALSFAPLISANRGTSGAYEWTAPLGLGITRTTVFNGRPINIGVHYYRNVDRSANQAANQLRFGVSLLYPKRASS